MEATNLDSEITDSSTILPVNKRFRDMTSSFVILIPLLAILIFCTYYLNKQVIRAEQGSIEAAIEANNAVTYLSISLLLFVAVAIFTLVMYCMWVYRVGYNIHVAYIPQLSYTPGWYVGWMFIPIVGLIMLFFTFSEIDKATQSLQDADTKQWRKKRTSWQLVVWYILFIVEIVVSSIADASENVKEIEINSIQISYSNGSDNVILSILDISLTITSVLFFYLFAKKITRLQEQYRQL